MTTRYGSDVVTDLITEAGVRHVALNPGASFRGIHDSLVQTPGAPELVLCLHEAVAVGVAQGYVKAGGRPMGVLLHNVVGLQNAAMAIYNAWCDRAPMMLIGGTGPKSKRNRRPWIDWIHTASVQGNLVRDFVVWDDEPHDLASVPESFARGWGAATSAPTGPVYLCYDVDLQEDPVPDSHQGIDLAAYPAPSSPAASPDDLAWMTEKLRVARRPVIVAGYVAETDAAFAALAELAELIGAPVIDTGVRHAIATTHRLCGAGVPGLLEDADVALMLDVEDPAGVLRGATAEILNVSLSHLKLRSWAHDYQSLVPASGLVTADADAVVRGVLDLLRQDPPAESVVAARGAELADRIARQRRAWRTAAAQHSGDGVVPLDRMLSEVGAALGDLPFVLANGTNQRLEHQLWALDRPRQYLGWHAGGGLGYGVPATIGAALALGKEVPIVDIQADGDLLFLPSALWTAVQQRTPTLFVVDNNRQYGNSVEHAQAVANLRGRDAARRYVGTSLSDPATDFASLASSFGMWARGPVSDATRLAEVLAAAVQVVRAGRPALVDVLTPGA